MKSLLRLILPLLASIVISTANALTFDGITFPQGAISFADEVVSYTPSLVSGGTTPSGNYSSSSSALGTPDWDSTLETGAVSLGRGGIIILKFVDNILTGSGTSDADLHIFEIGDAVEKTFVDISKDGSNWLSLNFVSGATSSIDIDSFGYGVADQFRYVRLTDDANAGPHSGIFAGADIDAVGAITTVKSEGVPDSGTSFGLLGLGILTLCGLRRRLR